MKKTIFIAMMLIGMMGSAQTMSNPIIIKSGEQVKEKVWHMYENDSSVIYYSNSDRVQTISNAKIIVTELMGQLTKPHEIKEKDNMVMYRWYVTDTKSVTVILNEVSSLISIREYE